MSEPNQSVHSFLSLTINISNWYSLAVLLRCRLKSDFDSDAEPLNFQAKFIDYYSVIWSSFLGIVVHTTVMGS